MSSHASRIVRSVPHIWCGSASGPLCPARHSSAKINRLRASGKILAVGGAAGGAKVTAFDGEPPKRAVVQVWDRMDKIQAWRNNPQYKALRKDVGDKYAKFRSYTIEGVPQ
jgi:uncharacterized protein (DUF1330 family)